MGLKRHKQASSGMGHGYTKLVLVHGSSKHVCVFGLPPFAITSVVVV